jgi:SP family sugar:H+ symporter-like MFS transporter
LSYGPSIFQGASVPLSGLECAVITNVCNLAGTMAMMVVIDRWGRRCVLLLGAAGMMVCQGAAAALAFGIEEHSRKPPVYLGWSLLVCICLYMVSFAIAWGGVPWVYPSEIFPMHVKEKALSTSTCSQWTANFLIAYIVPQQVELLKVAGTFTFYTGCLAVCVCLVYCLVPETKGIPLEDMDRLFGDSASSGEPDTNTVTTETHRSVQHTPSRSFLSAAI